MHKLQSIERRITESSITEKRGLIEWMINSFVTAQSLRLRTAFILKCLAATLEEQTVHSRFLLIKFPIYHSQIILQDIISIRSNVWVWTHEYTVFVSPQFLHKWREQQPNNEDDLDSSVTLEIWECLLHAGGTACDLICFWSTSLLLSCWKP